MKKVVIVAFLAFVTLSSCEKFIHWDGNPHSDPESEYNTFYGPQVNLGAGHARSWITISNRGVPKEIGVELTHEVLYGLPATNFSMAMPMHQKAKEATPFDHVYITWAAAGHPLPGTLIGPHFDVRFFMTSLEEQLAIPTYAANSSGFDNLPPAGYMPSSFYRDASVPQIGLHWTDKNFSNPVTKSMILGSYDGKFTFISPIMILEVLQSGQSYSSSYAQPRYFAENYTYYPTKYNIYMDNATKKHYITLSDFVLR